MRGRRWTLAVLVAAAVCGGAGEGASARADAAWTGPIPLDGSSARSWPTIRDGEPLACLASSGARVIAAGREFLVAHGTSTSPRDGMITSIDAVTGAVSADEPVDAKNDFWSIGLAPLGRDRALIGVVDGRTLRLAVREPGGSRQAWSEFRFLDGIGAPRLQLFQAADDTTVAFVSAVGAGGGPRHDPTSEEPRVPPRGGYFAVVRRPDGSFSQPLAIPDRDWPEAAVAVAPGGRAAITVRAGGTTTVHVTGPDGTWSASPAMGTPPEFTGVKVGPSSASHASLSCPTSDGAVHEVRILREGWRTRLTLAVRPPGQAQFGEPQDVDTWAGEPYGISLRAVAVTPARSVVAWASDADVAIADAAGSGPFTVTRLPPAEYFSSVAVNGDGAAILVSDGPEWGSMRVRLLRPSEPQGVDAPPPASGPATPAPAPPAPSAGAAGGPEPVRPRRQMLGVATPRRTLGRVRRVGLPVTVSCAGACRITAWAMVSRSQARSLHLRSRRVVVLGRRSSRLRGGGRRTVLVRLSRSARHALRGARRVKVTLRVEARSDAGTLRRASRTVTLRP